MNNIATTPAFDIDVGMSSSKIGMKPETKISIQNLEFFYKNSIALKQVSLEIPAAQVTAIIGPSGCGKSTLLRVLNKMYAIYPGLVAKGKVLLDGEDILDPKYSMNRLRGKVGMVFQKPVPFPMSVYENVAYALSLIHI